MVVQKQYTWAKGAVLDEHSRRKHKILNEYFGRYIDVRCQFPQQGKFRLAVVDGFCGGGRYSCGSLGSPLIFIDQLRKSIDAQNVRRAVNGMAVLDIECLLVFNDSEPAAIQALRTECAPLIEEIKASHPRLHLDILYFNEEFEAVYPKIKIIIQTGRYRNVLFNLDQCGHARVDRSTILDIMRSVPSAEIFYTFLISSLLAFLQKSDPNVVARQLKHLHFEAKDFEPLSENLSRDSWLGVAEKIVFDAFKECAPFVSPFSINNPDGWRYWLIHFANSYRARQVYNNVLHDNASSQAHFGRSGLDMLAYDPDHEGGLYLFDLSGREAAKRQLHDDIPRLITDLGDVVAVEAFYEGIYNSTPAHTDDVHAAIIENPDLEVVTESGGVRRKANTIIVGDTIRMKVQKSFFPIFFGLKKADDNKT